MGVLEERLQAVDAVEDGLNEASAEALLREGGLVLLMESAEGYVQPSPLSFDRAAQALKLLAQFHAAAWGDAEALKLIATRLHPQACYWTLERRGEEEMRQMRGNWDLYLQRFSGFAPELLSRPDIVALAARVERLAHAVAREMAPEPDDPFATLVHGDYKAMNIFFRQDEAANFSGAPALPIDFQWTGVGLGMADVAMHLAHSVAPEALAGNGETALLEVYRSSLHDALDGTSATAYTAEIANRHYCLGVVDYARMVFGAFFKGASPDSFASRAHMPNVGLAYKNVEASLLFVERVDRCLRTLEEDE